MSADRYSLIFEMPGWQIWKLHAAWCGNETQENRNLKKKIAFIMTS